MAPEQANPTQIPVPTSLTSASTALPPLTSHLLISHLRQTNAISDLSSLLTDSLARTGWTDRVQALALELLRNGSCDTFPELLEEVLRRCKMPAEEKEKEKEGKGARSGGKTIPNGTASQGSGGGSSTAPTSAPGSQAMGANGAGSITVREGWFGPDGLPDVKIPQKTVDAAVDFLKERIQDCVEPVDDEDD